MSKQQPPVTGDEIWQLRGEIVRLMERAEPPTSQVLHIAIEALSIAGGMEDRKSMLRGDAARVLG